MLRGNLPRMHDFDLIILVTEFFRQDPFRSLAVLALACVAVSVTIDVDLLRAIGFAEVDDSRNGEATAA